MRDVRQAFRVLSADRGFAAAAAITIALAVGGTSAIFSVIDGVLLRPLPYPEPDSVVRMWEVHPGAQPGISGSLLSHPTYSLMAAVVSESARDRRLSRH